jgi:transcriptional regulator with XRE-family HTH domain
LGAGTGDSSMNDRIKALIDATGLSVAQVARRVDLDRKTVDRALGGENPTLGTLERLAPVLGVSVVELVEALAAGRGEEE